MSTQSRYGNTNVNREYLTTPVITPIDYAIDVSGSYTTYSLVDKNYVDGLIAGSGDISEVNAGLGLTGGGTQGSVTLDAQVDNGLSISNDNIVLGGTLSQSTTIDLNSYTMSLIGGNIEVGSSRKIVSNATNGLGIDFGLGGTYSSYAYIYNQAYYNSVYLNENYLGIYRYTGGVSRYSYFEAHQDWAIMAYRTTDTLANMIFIDNDGMTIYDNSATQSGIAYAGDYSSNYTNRTLVDKEYVDNAVGGVSVGATNGVSNYSGDIGLGGTLSSDTTINANVNGLSITNLDGDGWNEITTTFSSGLAISDGFVLLSDYSPNAQVELGTNDSYLDVLDTAIYISSGSNTNENYQFTLNGANKEMYMGMGHVSRRFIFKRNEGTSISSPTTAVAGTGSAGIFINAINSTIGADLTEVVVAGADGASATQSNSLNTTNFIVHGGLSNYTVQPDTLGDFNDLTMITKKYVDDSVSGYLPLSGGTLTGNLIVDGDLTISGTATYVNTENLYVEDNIITLNATFSGTPFLDSGIEVNRGTFSYAKLIWDESQDYWVGGLSGSESIFLQEVTNGLTKTNNEVKLGGTLTENTTIDGDSYAYDLNLSNLNDFVVTGSGSIVIENQANNNALDLNDSGAVLLTSNNSGSGYTESYLYLDSTSIYMEALNGGSARLYMSANNRVDIIANNDGADIFVDADDTVSIIAGGGNETQLVVKDNNSTNRYITMDVDGEVNFIALTHSNYTTHLLKYVNQSFVETDYSSQFTNHTLVDKLYVDTAISNTKYTEFGLSLTAHSASTITHNLGTQSIICQAWDTSTGETVNVTFKNRATNTVDVLSTANVTVDVIIQS